MILLSFILLSLDAMEISALRTNRETYLFAVAVNQLQVMEERLLVSNQQSITQQLTLWNQENAIVLPQGRGTLDRSTLAIFWGDIKQDSCPQVQQGQSGCISKIIPKLG